MKGKLAIFPWLPHRERYFHHDTLCHKPPMLSLDQCELEVWVSQKRADTKNQWRYVYILEKSSRDSDTLGSWPKAENHWRNVRRLENFLPPIFCILDSWVWLICCNFSSFGASLIAQLVKTPPAIQETPVWFLAQRRDRLPITVLSGFPCDSAGKESATMRETWVWSQGWEDPLEKGKATHSSILTCRIPCTQPMGSQRVWHHWETLTFTSSFESKLF